MIEIYTDGACSHNGTWDGGWGVVFVQNGKAIHQFGGHEKETTNNRMEMMGVIKALEYMEELELYGVIYTDSAYVYNAFDKGWINTWQANGWKNSKKQPVKNIDLWRKMLSYYIPGLKKVKGHSDNEFNDLADKLATEWRDKT